MGVSSTLNAYIAALSCLFEYLMREKYNFRDLLGYIGSAEFRKKYLDKLENGSHKKIISMYILQKLLYKMDYYFSKDHGKSQDKIYHLLIVRVYIELSLIIPLKPSDLLEIKVAEIPCKTGHSGFIPLEDRIGLVRIVKAQVGSCVFFLR